jgi:hypothetical protein
LATPDSPKAIVLSGKPKATDDSNIGDVSGFSKPSLPDISPDHEVSFILSLYPNGYSIGKTSEVCTESLYEFIYLVISCI